MIRLAPSAPSQVFVFDWFGYGPRIRSGKGAPRVRGAIGAADGSAPAFAGWGIPPSPLDLWESLVCREIPTRSLIPHDLHGKYSGIRT